MARTTKVRDNNGSAEVTIPKFIQEELQLPPGAILEWNIYRGKAGLLITARKVD